jgi:hypothetical protein
MRLENLAKYELFIFVGLLIIIGAVLKLWGKYNFSSDWFWLLAGMGLVVEGAISYIRQVNFEKKFKVLDKEEYERLMKNRER